MKAAIGTTTTPGTLLAGLDQVRTGVGGAASNAASLKAGAVAAGGQLDQGLAALTALRAGMDPTLLGQYDAVLAQMTAGVPKISDATRADSLAGAAGALSTGLGGAAAGLAQVECGLSGQLAICPVDGNGNKPVGLLQAVGGVDDGISQLVNTVITTVEAAVGDADDVSTDNTLRGGVHSLQGGVNQIQSSGGSLATGLGQLGKGASELAAGSAQLNSGVQQLATGSSSWRTVWFPLRRVPPSSPTASTPRLPAPVSWPRVSPRRPAARPRSLRASPSRRTARRSWPTGWRPHPGRPRSWWRGRQSCPTTGRPR